MSLKINPRAQALAQTQHRERRFCETRLWLAGPHLPRRPVPQGRATVPCPRSGGQRCPPLSRRAARQDSSANESPAHGTTAPLRAAGRPAQERPAAATTAAHGPARGPRGQAQHLRRGLQHPGRPAQGDVRLQGRGPRALLRPGPGPRRAMGPVRVGPAPGRVGESERQPGMAGAGEGRVRACAGAVGRVACSAPALCALRPGPGRLAAQTAPVGSAAEQPGARPGFSGWALDPARPLSPLERSQAKTDLTRVT